MVYDLYSIKVCKSATIQYIRSRRSYCKWDISKKFGYNHKSLFEDFTKSKRRKSSEKDTHLRIKNSRGKFSFGVLIFDVKRKDSHELLICLNSSTFKKKQKQNCAIFVLFLS